MKRFGGAMALVLLAAGAARGDGAVIEASALGPARADLVARVAAEKIKDPEIFAQARRIDAWRPEVYKRTRARRPGAIGIAYRRLGPSAVWALVELAALDGPPRAGATDAEWRALRVGVLDAIGVAREPGAAPLLRAAWDAPGAPEVHGAAAIGLGQLGEAELPLLLAHARAGDPRFTAAVRGLGASRRPRAAQALAALLDGAGAIEAVTIADALAEAGSPWAWATGRIGPAADEEVVRRVAAEALVRNYARLDGEAAAHAETAVRTLDRADRAMLDRARAAAPPARAPRLDRLAQIIEEAKR